MIKRSLLRAASLVIATGALSFVFVMTQQSGLLDSGNPPMPFSTGEESSLRGQLTQIGKKNAIDVVKVTFPAGTDKEILTEDKLFLVYVPDDSAVATVTLDSALALAGVHNVNYFGYKYTGFDALTEKANRGSPTIAGQFPGQFFASAKARAEDSTHGNTISQYETANNVQFLATAAGGVQLQKNSLYLVIVNETSPTEITIRGTGTTTGGNGGGAVCGNGATESPETCDDSNTVAGDGCSATCATESGYTCTGTPSVCTANPVCGNGNKETGEACDDSNTANGDGCSNACAVESGYTCTGNPSVCTPNPVCGNGNKETGEACDDSNTANGDGCDNQCSVESGFTCTGNPSVCTPTGGGAVCGNGAIEAPEVCDDSNTASGDGCSSACAVESEFRCTGAPSVCVSYLNYVKGLADINNNGTVSDNEALLLTLDVADAPSQPYNTVVRFDMDLDGDVDNSDITAILAQLEILAP